MPALASLAAQRPASVGAIAAGMAIGGFLLQARPAIKGASEQELRKSAAIGGIVGLCLGIGGFVLGVTLSL